MQHPLDDGRVEPSTIANWIIKVCRELHNSREGKKHGAWLVYEEKGLKLMYDDYHPSTWVGVDGFDCVWSMRGGAHSPTTYRPGRWVVRLQGLYHLAREKAEQRKLDDKRQAEQERLNRYGAIDDSAVFPHADGEKP
jgi:hypothetical protein